MSGEGQTEIIQTSAAPAAIGPYCQGCRFGELLFCSGQLPLDPETGELVRGGVGEMTKRCLENLEAICAAAGTSLDCALKLTVYVCDLAKFGEVNEAYASFFTGPVPARATVQVAALPAGAEVEIDAIVACPEAL